MKSKAFKLICSILIFSTASSFGQNVDEVISKYVAAMGGKDKIQNLKTMLIKGKAELSPGMTVPFTISIKNRNASRFDMTIQGMTMTQVVEGDSGWYISPFEGKKDPERMPAEMVKESKSQNDLSGPLYNYKEKGNTVELLGKEDMEGTETYKLKVTEKEGDVSYHYLDASTYYELKETRKHKLEEKEVESETVYSNYKMVDGILFAFTREDRQAGMSTGQVINFDGIEVNPAVDDAIFKMPKKQATTETK